MLSLFNAVVLVKVGLNCDCCVEVSQVHADVFAHDEAHARELINKFDRNASVEVILLQDNGSVGKVENPGMIVTGSPWSIYRGYYGNDSAIAKAKTEAKAAAYYTQG